MRLHTAPPKAHGLNGRSVSGEESVLLTRQLYVLEKAGVPLLSSLRAIEAQLAPGALKTILQEVHQDLLSGKPLSQALARHPKVFGPVYLGMISVGEAGGLLEEMLKRLAELLEWELELRAKLKQAVQYPLIVLGTLTIAIVLMVTFVLPQFAKFFSLLRVELPIQTRLLMGLSLFMKQWGWLVGLVLIAAGVAWGWYLRTEQGRLRWHRWQLRLPVVGALLVQLGMSRVSRTLSVLTASGVPILETLALAGQSINNRCIRSGLSKVRERVKGGEALANAMQTDNLFPAVVVQMVATGEETGRMDELLRSVSEYYDQQVNYRLKRLITYIEPVLLILVGLGVLVMATAVLVPMWDLVKVLKIGR